MRSERSPSILIVDDDRDVSYTAGLVVRNLFQKVDVIDRPGLLPQFLSACKYDVILLDMNFSPGSTSGKEGLDWIGRIHEIDPSIRILSTTAYGEIDLAVQAMKNGATDFIIKPWSKAQLIASVQNALQSGGKGRVTGTLRKCKTGSNDQDENYPETISRSEIMAQILETMETVAPTDANVLIMGENGTGKELAAWTLHCKSMRKGKPFVHVDLGAIPETLFEAELFGHKRGAFTDAREDRAGRFEDASGGTLFLDEIGNLGMPLQAKILTAIQNKKVVRIGSNNQVPVNVRLITATNMPLYEMADSFSFRQDLLYRINTVEIMLPPLRDRKEDIEVIADHYLRVFSERYGKPGIKIRGDAYLKMHEYHWPGNIRELAHCIERAVILCKRETLTSEDFPLKIKSANGQADSMKTMKVEDFERNAIASALGKYNGNLSKAAEELGIARSTLYRKIAHFGLEVFNLSAL
jgi:two-component system, NtrC family, response regulator HydG